MFRKIMVYIIMVAILFPPLSPGFAMERDELEKSPLLIVTNKRPAKINLQQMNLLLKQTQNVDSLEEKSGTEYTSAGIIYKNSIKFFDDLNQEIYTQRSLPGKVMQTIIAIFGSVLTPALLSNLVLYSTGDLLDEINPEVTTAMEWWLICTTAPIAYRTAFDFGGAVIDTTVSTIKKIGYVFRFIKKKITQCNKAEENKREDSVLNHPLATKRNGPHIVSLVCLWGSNILNGGIPTSLIVYEERFFPVVPYICIGYMMIFYGTNYWKMGKARIDTFFNRYDYQSPDSMIKRNFLVESIDAFLDCIQKSTGEADSLAGYTYSAVAAQIELMNKKKSSGPVNSTDGSYKVINALDEEDFISIISFLMLTDENRTKRQKNFEKNKIQTKDKLKNRQFELQQKKPFKRKNEKKTVTDFTELEENPLDESTEDPLVKEVIHLQEELKDLNLQETYWKNVNFRQDLFSIKAPSWREALLEKLSYGFVLAAYYGRVKILKYVVQTVLQYFGVDEFSAGLAAYGIAGVEVLFRSLVETDVHEHQFKGILSTFSFEGVRDLKVIRKIWNGVGTFNGFLFAAPALVVGLKAFAEDSWMSKVAFLLPSVVLDLSAFSYIGKERSNEALTGVATLKGNLQGVHAEKKGCGSAVSAVLQKVYLNQLAKQAKEYILNKSRNKTIDDLFELTHKAI